MKLSVPSPQYDPGDQARMRGAIEQADSDNMKRQVAVTYILMSRPDGTVGKLTVDNTNALNFTPL